MKFKKRDTVKLTNDLWGDKGEVCVIIDIDQEDDELPYQILINSNREEFWVDEGDIESYTQTKTSKVKFLLQYELDEDPVEEFETIAQVKKRIKELAKRDDLKRWSIVVYEIKKVMPIELIDSVKIKGL